MVLQIEENDDFEAKPSHVRPCKFCENLKKIWGKTAKFQIEDIHKARNKTRKEKKIKTEFPLKRDENENTRQDIHLLTDHKVALIELSYQTMSRLQLRFLKTS